MMTSDRRQDDAPRNGETRYAIGELAELGGVSRRTVRYYVQRGLLDAPTGVGRGSHYTQQHLDALIRIRELQEAGRPLSEIADRLERSDASADETPGSAAARRGSRQRRPRNVTPRPLPEVAPATRFSRWTRIEIADGVELHLRDARLDSRQARAVGEAIHRILQPGGRR